LLAYLTSYIYGHSGYGHSYIPFIELGVTTGFMPVGDLQRAKPLRSSG